MVIYVLNIERADDGGLKFYSQPFKSKDEALEEAGRRVNEFKDDIVREYARDGFVDERKDTYAYCTADWCMTLYIYCKLSEYDI